MAPQTLLSTALCLKETTEPLGVFYVSVFKKKKWLWMSPVSRERSFAFVPGSLFPSIHNKVKETVVTATQWVLNWVFHLHRARWESYLKGDTFKMICSFRTNCQSHLEVESSECHWCLGHTGSFSNSGQRTVFRVDSLWWGDLCQFTVNDKVSHMSMAFMIVFLNFLNSV